MAPAGLEGLMMRSLTTAALLGFMWMSLGVVASVQAKLYECTDAKGAKVFTDRPAQLKSCTPVKTGHLSSASPSRSSPQPPAARRPDNPQRVPRPPTVTPTPRQPQPQSQPSRGQVKPPSRPQAMGERPSTLRQSHATMAPPPSPDQRCVSPVNPLNPLLSSPCPPSNTPPAQ